MEKQADHRFSRGSLRPGPSLVLVRKRPGETSFSLVQAFHERLQRLPGKALKVIHGGALDPFAEGLMVMLVGPATKLFERLHEVPKSYVARIAWGQETDSLDALGRVVREAPNLHSVEAVNAALQQFLGWRDQVPPATSNKRVGGERAYTLAHRGETVELPASRVYLHRAEVAADGVTLRLTCGGGFYVRSLVRDLARALGTAAHLVTLDRTQIGPWVTPADGDEVVLTGAQLLPWLPARVLTDDEWGRLRGAEAIAQHALAEPQWPLPSGFPPVDGWVRCLHHDRLVTLAKRDGDLIRPVTVLQTGV